MKAQYSQTDGTHGTLVANIIVPRESIHGDVMLYGFNKSEDCSNLNRAVCYAGALTYYKLTDEEKSS